MELTESKLLNKLYSGECRATLQLLFNGTYFNFSVDLLDARKKPDCCIAHYGFGIFVRTEKGLKGEKYKSIEDLKRDCAEKLRTNGITPVAIIITGDDFSQRLTIE